MGADEASQPIGPGKLISGKYLLSGLLGEGAQGAVYEAENQWTGRRVALKLLRPEIARDDEAVARFMMEARICTKIAHPNIVEVLDLGREPNGGVIFMVSELLRGMSLRQVLQRDQRLNLQDTVDILVPVMGALLAAHVAGVVHRDLKPENIFVAQDRVRGVVPKLMDFGVSKVLGREGQPFRTRSGFLIGTPEYMSPEQVRGEEPIDAQSDVWAMGLVFYEALSGVMPFAAPNLNQIIVKIVMERPVHLTELVPDLPHEVTEVIHQAIEPDRERRFPSMRSFLEALLECQSVHYGGRRSPSVPPVDSLLSDRAHAHVVLGLDRSKAKDPRARPPSVTITDSTISADDLQAVDDEEQPLPELPEEQVLELSEEDVVPAGPQLPRIIDVDDDLDDFGVTSPFVLVPKLDGLPSLQDAHKSLSEAKEHNWEGNGAKAEQAATMAMESFAIGEDAWFEALSELAQASVSCGHIERLTALAEKLEQVRARIKVNSAFVIAAHRLAIQMVFAGWAELADTVLSPIAQITEQLCVSDRSVLAWVERQRGLLAQERGDLGTLIREMQASSENFSAIGEPRLAAMQSINVGNGLVLLGQYEQAAELFRNSISLGVFGKSPYAVKIAQSNLAVALTRMKHPDEAVHVLTEVLSGPHAPEIGRLRAYALTYLAQALLLRGDAEAAERYALSAVAPEHRSPPARAYALGTLAEIRLQRGFYEAALEAAREASDLLDKTQGEVHEGEGYIRLAYARALANNSRLASACKAITVARNRVLERADRITDPLWRDSFLQNVDEHATTLRLARIWLVDV